MSMRSPALAGPGITVYLGDCLDVLAEMEDHTIDAIVTDPPYDLTSGKKGGTGQASLNVNSPAGRSRISTGFMGKAWDGTGIAFRLEVWAECLRVLKPGGHLLAPSWSTRGGVFVLKQVTVINESTCTP